MTVFVVVIVAKTMIEVGNVYNSIDKAKENVELLQQSIKFPSTVSIIVREVVL